MRLTREGFSPWQLEGMDPATQEIISLPIESTLTMLDQMEDRWSPAQIESRWTTPIELGPIHQ